MALRFGGNLAIVLVVSSMFAMAIATITSPPRKIIVGGSEKWHFGYNYTDWALKFGTFRVGDVLVFKYDPPNASTFAHSVYLFPNYRSFLKCDLKKALKIADVNQGGGEGFEFRLNIRRPYYFACGEHNGFHCNNGTMKFSVLPCID